jgi:predicted amidohydrolase YtcJ
VLIVRAEIDGRGPFDVRLRRGRVAAIGRELERRAGETVLDAGGGGLLRGLHDHHLHLFALAAAGASVRCGPPEVRDARQLAGALAAARVGGGMPGTGSRIDPAAGVGDRGAGRERRAGGGWIRGVGYHESVAGDLDRAALDRLVPDRPVRIQHRSGGLWILNSAALARVGLERGAGDEPGAPGGAGLEPPQGEPGGAPAGVEHGAGGRPTGRLFGLDAWLRERLEAAAPPDLGAVGRRLASFGVTGLTDATPGNSAAELHALAGAVERGALPQRLVVMGRLDLPRSDHPAVARGAVKVRLEERELPAFDQLAETIARAHREDRAVAVHCVTRAELVLAAAAFAAAGARPGDRIEHAAVAPPEAIELLAALPLTVVTQPGFIRERGDAYRAGVAPADRPWLYRCRGFLDAGIPLGGSTDAPFGDPDPWLAMRAAVDRRTAGGAPLGPDERLTPEQALGLFTAPLDAPGGRPRAVRVGVPADLCLLDRPWSAARRELSSACVRATLRDGAVVWRRD